MRRCASVLAVVAVVAVLVGCGTASDPRAEPSGITVDTTVAPVTDIVRQVVGDRVDVVGLVPEGVDSHTFEPSPSTVRALSEADVLFAAGLELETSILKLARANMAARSTIVELGNRTIGPDDYVFDFSFPKDAGNPNPHLWMDPLFAKRWAEIVRDTMVEQDPTNAGFYEASTARFATAVDGLDAAIRQAVESIPPGNRKLLTYHDAFAYFARRYGMTVVGAVQPSDFSEPDPRDVERLIAQVRAEGVPAVFGSEVFPSEVLEQVAREGGARYVDQIRDDELPGSADAPGHTYLGMMVENVTIITTALGGDPAPLDGVVVAPTWQP